MHNIQRSSLWRAKLDKKKKLLSDKKQTHPHIYHANFIGSHLGQHSVGLFNIEKLHQNTLVSNETCPGLYTEY